MSHAQLIKLSVRTKSDVELGRIDDIVYDIEGHTVLQYVVHSGMIRQHEYRIHPVQVLSVTEEKMIVEDTVERLEAASTESRPLPSGASPAMMREE